MKHSHVVPHFMSNNLGLYHRIQLNSYNQLSKRLFLFTSEVAKIFWRFSLAPAFMPGTEVLQSVPTQAIPMTPENAVSLHINTPRSAPELSAAAMDLIGPLRDP